MELIEPTILYFSNSILWNTILEEVLIKVVCSVPLGIMYAQRAHRKYI